MRLNCSDWIILSVCIGQNNTAIRPVARGSWGFWRPPLISKNFQKLTNLVAVYSFPSSTIPYFPKKTVVVCWFVQFVCVKMRLRTFQFQKVIWGIYPRTPLPGGGDPLPHSPPARHTAVCWGASEMTYIVSSGALNSTQAPRILRPPHIKNPSNMVWLRAWLLSVAYSIWGLLGCWTNLAFYFLCICVLFTSAFGRNKVVIIVDFFTPSVQWNSLYF